MAGGMYDSAADALGVKGEPMAEVGFSPSEAVNFLTGPPEKDPRWVPDSGGGAAARQEKVSPSALEKYVTGPLETIGTLATGAVAAPIGAAAGLYRGLTGGKYGTAQGAREASARAAEVAQSLTYQPRTETGQEGVEQVGKAIEASKLGGLGPSEGVSLAGIMAGPRIAKPAAAPIRAAPQQMARASVGAAGATPAEQVQALASRASPETQAVVQKIGPEKVNPAVLERHVEAESLPVPVRLTRGQATQDVSLISSEQNLRGKHPEIANRLNEQNKALVENADAIRERAAPDVYVRSAPEIGDIIIDAYKAKDAAANANISNLYGQLREANGGQFPLDAKAFVTAADQQLHKGLLFDHVPPEIRRTMDRLGNTMSFENFESLRTNLARIQRSQSADGNAKAAAGVIRQSLEDMPLLPEAQGLKQIADSARAAAKDRFTAIEGDPAYKAVVTGKASADKFVNKYIVSADLKNVEAMKRGVAHDPAAQQAMAAGTIDHLKGNALRSGENFSQAGYNKALEALGPKVGVIFAPAERQNLETLGRVSRYTQAQPRGSYVNTSNTMTAAVAEHAKGAAEGAVNVAAHGIPLGTWVRRLGGKYMDQRDISNALQPGAGILLKDVAK